MKLIFFVKKPVWPHGFLNSFLRVFFCFSQLKAEGLIERIDFEDLPCITGFPQIKKSEISKTTNPKLKYWIQWMERVLGSSLHELLRRTFLPKKLWLSDFSNIFLENYPLNLRLWIQLR